MRKAGEVSFADILKDRDGEGLAIWLFYIEQTNLFAFFYPWIFIA
jgi:hypothetical protein